MGFNKTPRTIRYRVYRQKVGWRVVASGVQQKDGWLEFQTYDGKFGRTRQWQVQIKDPERGWIDFLSESMKQV